MIQCGYPHVSGPSKPPQSIQETSSSAPPNLGEMTRANQFEVGWACQCAWHGVWFVHCGCN